MAASATPVKKHGCLKAFFITIFVIALIIWVIIGAAFIVGDVILKKQFGVSLYDVICAVNDIGVYNDDEIVTNPYDKEKDADKFYDAVNDAMFFKNSSSGTSAVINSKYVKELMDGGDPTNALLDLLDKNNFNTEALAEYDGTSGSNHLENISSVKDTELAAFVNDFIIDSSYLKEIAIGEHSLSDFLNLDQLILRMGEDISEDKREAYDIEYDDHVYLTMTCSLDTKDMVKAALKNYLPGIARWAIGFLLPAKSYVSVTVDLNNAEYGLNLELNSLSSIISDMKRNEKNAEIFDKYANKDGKVSRMDRIYIIAECFSGMDLIETVNGYGGIVTDYLCVSDSGFSVGNMIAKDAFNEDGKKKTVSKDGKFKVDMYGLFATMLNGSTGGNATGKDIIVLLQSLLCTSGEEGFNRASGSKITTEEQADAYSTAFMNEVYNAYGLNIADKGFDEFVKLLTDDTDKSDISGQGIEEFAGATATKSGTAQITDGMFAAMIYKLMNLESEEFSDKDGADTGFNAYSSSLTVVAIREENGEVYADMTVRLNLAPMVPESNRDLFEKLIPTDVTVSLRANITPHLELEESEKVEPAAIVRYNELSKTSDGEILNGLTVDDFFASFSAIVPSLDLTTVTDKFAKGVRVVVDNLDNSLHGAYEFVPTAA